MEQQIEAKLRQINEWIKQGIYPLPGVEFDYDLTDELEAAARDLEDAVVSVGNALEQLARH